ncbi:MULTISPECIES: DUF6758 family protein [unclassified Nocardioides]|uniref:DUF6758 family protein n=1 Tax=unclassified Nocardioides TaxID=2615069 RepID=UPI0006FBC2AB|nr:MULTISPECIES: DUF6758 family protein [unclassified Nocardioides]KQY56236.1 hypothetical protein ASD30_07715 [Nocardioides sp. Root140]KQZ75020.1 hypothetical protein ASD66_01180 [Nocardioides sp. Root151]
MSLNAGCPRCPSPLMQADDGWRCGQHGTVPPLWSPDEASYDDFGEHLNRADDFPTYLPWPLASGWRVTDFGVVRGEGRARATMVALAGNSDLDGPVEVLVVSEEPGTGLGARCAGTVHSDPGAQIGASRPTTRVRLDAQPVSLWPVSTAENDLTLDRSVVAGEARGRWLWLVLRPASAVFLLADDLPLADVSGIGASLLEVPFGGPPPRW